LLKLRPDSYPYITGDGFRQMANHIYDESKKCRPKDIKDGQIVFLRSDMINDWFKNIIGQLEKVWNIIKEERITGYQHRAPIKRVKKEAPIKLVINNDSECFLKIVKLK
jgi:hypothetical protein